MGLRFSKLIGLSLQLMNGLFEFIEKPFFLEINSQFRSEDPSDKIWDRNIEKYGLESRSK